MKSCYARYSRPENVNVHKVDLNDEVPLSIVKCVRKRDIKLWSIQASVARAIVPMMRVIHNLLDVNKGSLDKQQRVDMAIYDFNSRKNFKCCVIESQRALPSSYSVITWQTKSQGNRLDRHQHRPYYKGMRSSNGRYQPYWYYSRFSGYSGKMVTILV